MPALEGISRIDLTVSDCDRAGVWRQDVLGFTLVHRTRSKTFETRTSVHPSGIAATVMTHDGTQENGAFDERRVGLDHLAFRVADLDELQRWVTHLETKGVTHSGIIDIGYGPTLVFRDPDNKLFVHSAVHDIAYSDPDSAEAQRVLHEATQGFTGQAETWHRPGGDALPRLARLWSAKSVCG